MANPTQKLYTAASDGLTPSAFVALIIPVNCIGYLLKNNGPDVLYMRSNPADPATEDSMGAGFYEDLLLTATGDYERRFSAGDTLYWVKCTGPLLGKFFI